MRRFATQYRDFFRLPDVANLMAVALLSRMPIGMVGLAGPYRLVATLAAGRIDPVRTVRRHDRKAPTFHGLGVEPGGGGWWASVVLDI